MIFEVVEPRKVPEIWRYVYAYIEDSQRRGPTDELNAAAMRNLCATDETWRLVCIHDGWAMYGAAVIRVLDDGLFVSAIGGKFPKRWEHEFFGWLSSIAGFMGLKAIRLGGRKGWRRLLAPLGFLPAGGPYLECRL